MSFRECAHDELRKNRNDLIFIKDNLFIPEDIDRGPTEDMININDIIIPPWVRVCEIPTNVEGVSDQRKEFVDVLDHCVKLIEATYSIIKADGSFRFSTNAIDYSAMKLYNEYLGKTYELLERAGSLIPVNFNMYLIRVAAYAGVLAGSVEPLMTQIASMANDPVIKTLISSEDFIYELFTDIDEWKTQFDSIFENGVYCGDFDSELSPLAVNAAEILSRANTAIIKISSGSYTFKDIMDALLKVQGELHRVMTADYHLERSKAPLKSFNKTSIEEEKYIPKLPYDYVHQRYYIEIEDSADEVVDETPHMFEHDHRMIGDYIF